MNLYFNASTLVHNVQLIKTIFRWPFNVLITKIPVAMNTDATIAAIKYTLYPRPVPKSPFDKEPTCQQAALPRHRLLPKDVDLIAALKQVKLGTSPGPFADSTDLLCFFALMAEHLNEPEKEAVYPNFATC